MHSYRMPLLLEQEAGITLTTIIIYPLIDLAL